MARQNVLCMVPSERVLWDYLAYKDSRDVKLIGTCCELWEENLESLLAVVVSLITSMEFQVLYSNLVFLLNGDLRDATVVERQRKLVSSVTHLLKTR